MENVEDVKQQNATDTCAECPAQSLFELDDGNGILYLPEPPHTATGGS